MIEQLETEKEHDVLGFRIKVHPNEEQKAKVPSQRVIDFVQDRVEQVKRKFPHLDNAQIAVLVAMNCARERLEIEDEYRENIESIELSATQALNMIESISPQYN